MMYHMPRKNLHSQKVKGYNGGGGISRMQKLFIFIDWFIYLFIYLFIYYPNRTHRYTKNERKRNKKRHTSCREIHIS